MQVRSCFAEEHARPSHFYKDKTTDNDSIAIVRLGGTLVLIGLLSQTVTLNLYDALPKQVNILCSFGGTHTDLRASLDLIAKGVIVPQVQLGKLADFPTILQDLHSGKIKSRIVLVPEGIENVQV